MKSFEGLRRALADAKSAGKGKVALSEAEARQAVDAADELLSALALFVRTADLQTASDAGFRQIVKGVSQQLFEKHANPVELDRHDRDLRVDAAMRALLADDHLLQ